MNGRRARWLTGKEMSGDNYADNQYDTGLDATENNKKIRYAPERALQRLLKV